MGRGPGEFVPCSCSLYCTHHQHTQHCTVVQSGSLQCMIQCMQCMFQCMSCMFQCMQSVLVYVLYVLVYVLYVLVYVLYVLVYVLYVLVYAARTNYFSFTELQLFICTLIVHLQYTVQYRVQSRVECVPHLSGVITARTDPANTAQSRGPPRPFPGLMGG